MIDDMNLKAKRLISRYSKLSISPADCASTGGGGRGRRGGPAAGGAPEHRTGLCVHVDQVSGCQMFSAVEAAEKNLNTKYVKERKTAHKTPLLEK